MGLPVKKIILSAQAVLIFSFLVVNLTLPKSNEKPQVLADTTFKATAVPAVVPTSSPSLKLTESIGEEPGATPAPITKSSYVIAFIGDSMVETMGAGLPYVYEKLKEKYPKVEFSLYNYGIGSENVIEAISRFSLPYAYKDQKHEPIDKLGADIIVVGSYAYNPITPFDRDEQWLLFSDLVGRAKQAGKEVYVLAEQAPILEGFGEGKGGVNWPLEITKLHTENIILGLENAVGLAETLNVGIVNVFEKSKLENSKYGKEELVTTHDGIHYSEEGQHFTAEVIVESLKLE